MFQQRDMLRMWRRLPIIGMYYNHGIDVELQWTMSGKLLLSKELIQSEEIRTLLQVVGGNRWRQGAVANEDLPVL